MIALIPARAGSARVPGKNTRPLAGKPLIRWTIEAALESSCFDEVYVCSDDLEVLALALAASPVLAHHRDPSADDEKDVEWVCRFLQGRFGPETELCLLRPTSPLRGPDTIRRALEQWEACKDRLDSLRAVRVTTETAWKQWVVEDYIECPKCRGSGDVGGCTCGTTVWPCPNGCEPVQACDVCAGGVYKTMVPLTTASAKKKLYEFPTQSLTDSYIQTGAIEIFRADLPLHHGNISGEQVGMFLTEGDEAIDVDTEDDWERAERALGKANSSHAVPQAKTPRPEGRGV